MSGEDNPSERRRAEEALRESEARMRAVIDGVADAIVTLNEGGTIQSVNLATTRMFGYGADELVGRNVNVLAPESRRSLYDGYIRRYLHTGGAGVSNREVEARRKDGSTFPAELTVSEIRRDQQRLFIGFVRDLSERRQFEACLDRLHKGRLDLMTNMTTALAHEINQPLAAALNYLSAARQILGAEAVPNRFAAESLEKAAAQVLRAANIISHLREFMVRGEPNKVERSLHALIRGACDLMQAPAKEAGVAIVLLLNAAEDQVLADQVQVEQAILNLMRNAIEAMSEARERELTIATSLDEGMVRTDVSDTGPGLNPSARSGLFVPFASTKPKGLGVGLSISRSIIEAHYGTIWADDNPGGGARFSFTMPLARLESSGD